MTFYKELEEVAESLRKLAENYPVVSSISLTMSASGHWPRIRCGLKDSSEDIEAHQSTLEGAIGSLKKSIQKHREEVATLAERRRMDARCAQQQEKECRKRLSALKSLSDSPLEALARQAE